ncbi:MAG: RuBisCO large subunit C-terminal-like domain-containing protein, partial [Candidatus Hydrothermarchaeales archaeon]
QSTGTWTKVGYETTDIQRKYGAKIEEIDRENRTVKLSFPLEDFSLDKGGISNILSVVAGNLFGLKELENVRLLDVDFPKEFVRQFNGPSFGISGVRKLIGTKDRPHLGTIVKPKIGLSPDSFADVCYEAAMGGVDFIKDDETLANQVFCPIEERISKVVEKLDQVKEETGRTILYSPNVTSDDILETAQIAVDNGASALMIDVLTAGFPSLRTLNENFDLPIHVHRTMHAAITKNPKHGIAMLVFSRLVRLAGGDQLHVGCPFGKMEGSAKAIKENYDALRSGWFGLKTVFPVCSGGVHPLLVEGNLEASGTDIVIQAGGGIHGHPLGTRKGATAMRQAIDAFMEGVSTEEYADDHEELRLAIEKWRKDEGLSGYRKMARF